MTKLETAQDALAARIQPRKEFDKTRRALRKVIRLCLEKWSPSDSDGILEELNEKLADVNRRPLLAKLDLLAKRWGVPLGDINQASLHAAKNARDRIAHRGQYYEEAKDKPRMLVTIGEIEEQALGDLIRRCIADLAFFTTWCPAATSIEKLVAVEGHRWAIEDSFETAKNEFGLDHNESRSWHGWHRHVSMVMLAFVVMAVIRHRANPVLPKKTKRQTKTKTKASPPSH